ncbi:UNVERIFIED_CONTAM: hypothetical protein Slati_3885700 [Sesamum latifolium]|uniref:Uncharacterized protein n=1 Tax=Sesamum latifolium TaxID=2727402 RepID=A0AAW2TLA2_9LAMI
MRASKHDGRLARIPPDNASTRGPQKGQLHYLGWHVLLRGYALRAEERRSYLLETGGQNIPTSTRQEHGGLHGRYARKKQRGLPSCGRLRRNLRSTKKVPVKAQSWEMRIRGQWGTFPRIHGDPARYRSQFRQDQGHPGHGTPPTNINEVRRPTGIIVALSRFISKSAEKRITIFQNTEETQEL